MPDSSKDDASLPIQIYSPIGDSHRSSRQCKNPHWPPSGSSKSRLAARLSTQLAITYHELDVLHHGPGWVKRESFKADVRRCA